MSEVRIEPANGLSGTIRVPGDKSIAHRALLLGAIANGWTRITGVPRNADVTATIRALGACGVQVQCNGDAVIVNGGGAQALRADGARIDCANSGTTMRLLMGVLASHAGVVDLMGDASLSRRPMQRVAEPLALMGASAELSPGGCAPLRFRGSPRLRAIDYALPVASAQIKTALIVAALGAEGTTRLRGRVDSRDHTERMLPLFGAALTSANGEIAIAGGQHLRGAFVDVPGDPSSAAVWIAAALAAPHGDLRIPGVSLNRTRMGFVDAARAMGACIETRVRRLEPEPVGTMRVRSGELRGITVGADTVPALIDELPLIAVLATQARGRTLVRGARELRVKECDRIEGIAAGLRAMGARVETFPDGFAIEGPQRLRGAAVDSCGDHRIAMALAVAAMRAAGPTLIRGAECVAVSYPGFFEALAEAV